LYGRAHIIRYFPPRSSTTSEWTFGFLSSPAFWLVMLRSVSQSVAIYCLFLLKHAVAELLVDLRPAAKFWCASVLDHTRIMAHTR
jgi:hypothetical protein